MQRAELLPVLLIGICLLRILLISTIGRLETKLKLPTSPTAEELSAKELKEAGTYDPTFVDVIETRELVAQTNSPATFVEHAKAQRRLSELERRWTLIYEGLSFEEKKRYSRAAHTVKPASPEPMSLFLQFVSATDDTQRQAAMENIQNTLRGSVGKGAHTGALAGLKSLTTVLEYICIWVTIHMVMGWSLWLKEIPIYSFPVDLFRPFIKEKVSFPLSWFARRVEESEVQAFLIDQDYMTEPFLPTCDVHITFGYFFTVMLIGQGMAQIKKELSPTGAIPRAYKLLKDLVNPPKMKGY